MKNKSSIEMLRCHGDASNSVCVAVQKSSSIARAKNYHVC